MLMGSFSLRRLWRIKWMKIPLIVLGVIGILVAIWFGLPMTGIAFLASPWFRGGLIGAILLTIFLVWFIRWRKRRKAAQALEEELIEQPPEGDAKVLAERMNAALDKLKKSGGKTYLYDLPWYVIIGPPGAGKTTALMNSGIEFPGSDTEQGAIEGFGGTKDCDWWFAEDAVLIDTAGRYTTQDSNAEADEASWTAFLELLKKGRPNQPINGVILAYSAEDMLTQNEEELERHAAIVRERLGEIHEALKIDFPVYVLFTKSDLIAGFREYFASFNQSRRKSVWGVTFQTKDRKEQTFSEVGAEFDLLVSRLSDEVIDRMSEEPDGISRISIFGLPGQMAMLRDNIEEFMRRVFEPTRYKTNAMLRGFYFTSGTQEGTPIDQVLGAMARAGEQSGAEFQPAFMSGRGKSFFLHDLMKKVIFEERDWVSHDQRAVRRAAILRTIALVLIALVTVGSMAGFGYSFWRNMTLVKNAEQDGIAYFRAAQGELARSIIDDPDPAPTLAPLETLRLMTAGYGDTREPSFFEGLGLGQHRAINVASRKSYSDALERMLRPRMLLHLENQLPLLMRGEDTAAIFRALKVYLLLGGQQGGAPDDAAIQSYFSEVWREEFSGAGDFDDRDALEAHLAAMLELDDERRPNLALDPDLIAEARVAVANLPLAEQAYAAIKDRAINSGIPDFNLEERISGAVAQVFETTDGLPLSEVTVPALFTFEGYWGFFLEEMTKAGERLEQDRWVLGEAAANVNYNEQLGRLERDLHSAYQLDFVEAWNAMFARIGLAPLSADGPRFDVLAAAASPVNSPILELVEAVEEETRLTRLYEQADGLTAEDIASGNLGNSLEMAAFRRMAARGGVFQRIVLQHIAEGRKNQGRAGATGEDTQRRQVERITEKFENWHVLLKGEQGSRPIDVILKNLSDIRDAKRNSATRPTARDDELLQPLLLALTRNNTALPEALAGLLNEAESEFRSAAEDATMAELNRALNDEVAFFCRDNIAPFFPFGNGRHVAPSSFGQFFGPTGRMELFYGKYLQSHLTRTANGLAPIQGSTLGERLSPATLKQFDRAHAISLAFFGSGGDEPSVDISVTHVASSPTVKLAVLTMNGASARTQPGGAPVALSWPGVSSGMSIELSPAERGRESVRSFANGRWSIVDFLRKGRARVSGQVATVTHQVGGRTITYQLEFDSNTVPFLMPELSQFSCPTSLE